MNNSFNIQSNRALIQREQTYVLEKKLLAVHSEDRDFTQFPNSNSFSIDIGESMTNVESVRLVSYAFPNNCYNISTSYQNTKLAYSYQREYMFDASTIPIGPPTISQNDLQAGGTPNPGGAVATGGADFRLGMFQCVLEQLFPGIIRPFRSTGAGVTVDPSENYFTSGQITTDWNNNERGMIYTTQTTFSVPPHPTLTEPEPNFGSLGLPETVDVFYENLANEWISIKPLLPFRNTSTSTVWPIFIDEWQKDGPVPEDDWTGRFKICFILKNRIITLPEGAYSPDNLANVIQNKLNEQIESYANTIGHQFVATGIDNTVDVNTLGRTRRPEFFTGVSTIPSAFTVPYTNPISPWNNDLIRQFKPIVVLYNPTTNNLSIGASEGSFALEANREIKYSFDKCSPNKYMFSQYTKWGLPYYMGFNKQPYDTFDINLDSDIILNDEGEGVLTTDDGTVDFPRDLLGNPINNIFLSGLNGLILYTNSNDNWIEPSGKGTFNFYLQGSVSPNPTYNNFNRTVSILSSPNNVNLMGEDCIYMEMEKFNNINEIYPFSERTNTMYNCDYGHKSDAAFAIIPLTQTPFGTELGNRTSINTNVFMSEPPIKNINRLEFKFRYHDGRLVDFKNLPFSFVLEFNMLREEQQRNKIIRIPHLY